MIASASLPKHNPNPAIRTGTPFIRVRVGPYDIWESGDRRLIDCSMTLAEGKNNSICEFTILDRSREIANRYFAVIYKNDGLDPLVLPGSNNNNRNNSISNRGRSGGNNLSDPQKVQEIIDFFKRKGFSTYAAAAMVGNMQQESSLDPSATNNDQCGDNLPEGCPPELCESKGLIQWTCGRREGSWGAMPYDDFYGQLEFVLEDMQRDSPSSLETLLNPDASEEEIRQAYEDWIRWGDPGSRWNFAAEALEIIEEGGSSSQSQASNSVQNAQQNTQQASTSRTSPSRAPTAAKVGQQITVEMGFDGQTFIAASFLHQSLAFDLFGPSTLTFGGQAVSYVLARRIKNTAYTNLTFKQIAQMICDNYGITLDMPEDGPTYEYLPQRGISDYEFLLNEARRIGWRARSVGNTLTIAPRSATIIDPGFVLVYGENLGTTFRVNHSAQGDSGGARASDPSDRSTAGQRKWAIDESGRLSQVQVEVDTGTAAADSSASNSSTSSNNPSPTPTAQQALATGATTGHHISTLGTVVQQDDPNSAENRANEKRLKGIKGEFNTPTTLEALVLDPDTTLYTANFAPEYRQVDVTGQLVITDGVQSLTSTEAQDAAIKDFLDRIWVVEKVTHSYSESGFVTTGTCYSPIKNRFPRQNSSGRNNAISDRNGNGASPGSGIPPELAGSTNEAIYNAIEAYKGSSTSAGPDGGNQACVWAINEALKEAGINPPWGNTDYVPTVETYLESNAAPIDPEDAQPGDIVISNGQYHIGVVDGSNSVISNSSSAANFRWGSDINFDGQYGGSSRIYRLP